MNQSMKTDLLFLPDIPYCDYKKFPSKVCVSVQVVLYESQNEFILKYPPFFFSFKKSIFHALVPDLVNDNFYAIIQIIIHS